MAAKRSIAPDIVWNCVTEALASLEQVDVTTLLGLLKLAPEISGEMGRHTREMISLRILESLFDHGNKATVGSTKYPKISFDVSERCEDVLNKILDETPEHMTTLDHEKWDIYPFLMHKKSSLPHESLLAKFKEVILVSRHPLLASLKEKSKLVTGNVFEDTSLVTKDGPTLNPRKDKKADQVGNSTKGTTESAGTGEGEMIIDTPLEGPSRNKSMDQHDAHTNTQHQHDQQQQLHCKDDNMPQDQNVVVDSMKSVEFVGKSNDPRKNIDIAAKKEAFLKYQCTTSQDSLVNLCMECNEGGQLLVCSSDACALQIHESCLNLAVTLNENGEFFCPFCAFSRAISKYEEAKQNLSLTSKNLQALSCFEVKCRPNRASMKQSELDKNEGRANINCMSSNGGDSGVPDPLIPDVNRSRRRRKRKAQCSPPPPFPLLRRRVLRWTKSEEETLKEGVERYTGDTGKKIPWKEILDFGGNVFHKGRTAMDLKDKWRNICKGIPGA